MHNALTCTLLLCVGEHDQGRLRFINSTYIFSTAGRLEIFLNGHWGTVCSVGFGAEDATLACNQLGYRTYRRYGTVGQLGWVFACVDFMLEWNCSGGRGEP